jgi:hypothetical protein
MVTLTTGIMFLLYIFMHFACEEFYEDVSRVCRPPMKYFAIAESLRNTALKRHGNYFREWPTLASRPILSTRVMFYDFQYII